MPKGIRGFRWVETGHKVWMLEDSPRHFRGVVSAIGDGLFAWQVSSNRDSGECSTRHEAMVGVESRVIPRTQKAVLEMGAAIAAAKGGS